MRGFFTTFLMKQRLGIFGFGNTELGLGLLVISFMLVKIVDLFQNNPVAVSIGSFPADDSFRFQVGKHSLDLPGAHT